MSDEDLEVVSLWRFSFYEAAHEPGVGEPWIASPHFILESTSADSAITSLDAASAIDSATVCPTSSSPSFTGSEPQGILSTGARAGIGIDAAGGAALFSL